MASIKVIIGMIIVREIVDYEGVMSLSVYTIS